jgi:hypothetical protein
MRPVSAPDTVPPTLVQLTRRALEGGGAAAPSSSLPVTLQGQTVTSGRRSAIPVVVGPVQPSLPLLRPAAHYCNHSDAVGHAGTGRHHACYCTPYGSSSTAPSSPPGDALVNCYASTLEAAPVQAQGAPRRHDWGKVRQDGRQLLGTMRHAAARSEIVRHACKSPSPWSIKGRRSPRRRGIGQRTAATHTLSASPRYWH